MIRSFPAVLTAVARMHTARSPQWPERTQPVHSSRKHAHNQLTAAASTHTASSQQRPAHTQPALISGQHTHSQHTAQHTDNCDGSVTLQSEAQILL